jgi:hypothetical protein
MANARLAGVTAERRHHFTSMRLNPELFFDNPGSEPLSVF